MKTLRFSLVDAGWWCLLALLASRAPSIQGRFEEIEQAPKMYRETPAPSTEQPAPAPAAAPAPSSPHLKLGKCFHMSREHCPPETTKCARVDANSVFCCDIDSFGLREALTTWVTPNTTNLHVLNATLDELDISQAVFRRLVSMAITDGNIGNIVGKFPKHSSIACLNISNNNLTSAKLQPASSERQFANLYNLTVLDASANNLTEFPVREQNNRKISIDLSGNNYLPCKYYQMVMEGNTSTLMTFLNFDETKCALDLKFNWFKDIHIVYIDFIRRQRELNASCAAIEDGLLNCTCMLYRLEVANDQVTYQVDVDCSHRALAALPRNLPPNTVKLNVSYNQITSLSVVSLDRSYEHLRQLIADHNLITTIADLEGTKFIDKFQLFTLTYNKLRTIHTYLLSNRFDDVNKFPYVLLYVAGNYIHCDCTSERVLKPWLMENSKKIPDFRDLQCDSSLGAVASLVESRVCHTPTDWTAIYIPILILVLLFSKVSYDYWVFRTKGYLPWPANKMSRLPCIFVYKAAIGSVNR